MHILHFNQRNQILFRYLRDKEKKERRGFRKGGVKIHPVHLPWIRAWDYRYACTEAIDFRRLQTLLINTREPENFSLKLPVWTFVIKESVHDTSWVSASIMCYVGDCRIGNVCTTCCGATYTSGPDCSETG